MLVYVIRRIFLSIPVLFGVLVVTFTLGFYGPGDPLTVFIGEEFFPDEAMMDRLRKLHGLDRPYWAQFGDFVLRYFRLDLGNSLHGTHQPIFNVVKKTLPISAQLGAAAAVVVVLAGISLGALAAVKQNTWIDYLIISFSIAVRSVPVFVLGPMLMIVLVLWLKIMETPIGWDGLFSTKAILPVFLMAAYPLLIVVRMTRAGVLETISQNYVRTARAKGLREGRVLTRHMLKNSLTPVLTSMGLIMSGLITGAIFVELIFGIPGFAGAGLNGFKTRDYPLIMATTVIGGLIIISANLLVDILYGFLDPRVRYE